MAKRTYENENIIVYWDSALCTHAAECLKGLPEVFNLQNTPWVDISKAPAEEIARVIDLCPSGALRYELKKTGDCLLIIRWTFLGGLAWRC